MLKFSELKISDKARLDSIFKQSRYCGADNAFGTAYIWQKAYNLKVCYCDGFLFRRYGENNFTYGYPLGCKDITEALNILSENCKLENVPLKLVGLTKYMVNEVEKARPGRFSFIEKRDSADYIYRATDLINLSGKKYHGKRNHITKFKKLYDWSFEPISIENKKDCITLIQQWCTENNRLKNTSGINDEIQALYTALEHFEELNFQGGIIKVKNKPVALTIGEKINDDVFVIHFEKALLDYQGSYSIINNEFAKIFLSGYKYINREEDLGIEGLRKAKLSYHPAIILEKYNAILRG